MSFNNFLVDFVHQIKWPDTLPEGVKMLYPFDQEDVKSVVTNFYSKYYSNDEKRILLFGINPGRFGAGVTGITFTDPIQLDKCCGISNPFDKKAELSSTFIYDMIRAFGGPEAFYSKCLLTSVFPFGFIKEGKNLNYYDIKELQSALEPHIIKAIRLQIKLGGRTDIAFSIGQGQNIHFLKKLNDEHRFFEEIRPLPHPRWVMQYRLKRKSEFINQYLDKLNQVN